MLKFKNSVDMSYCCIYRVGQKLCTIAISVYFAIMFFGLVTVIKLNVDFFELNFI